MNAGLDHPGEGSSYEQWRTASEMEKEGRSAVAVLIHNLHSDDKWDRIAAADALGNIGDRNTTGPLAKLMLDRDHDVRFATAVALGKLGGATAMQALEQASRDSNHYVRLAAEEALSRLKEGLES